MDSKTTITCSICLGDPQFPVVVQCGHTFCWKCLKAWLSSKNKYECPVCRNGIEEDRIVKLFTDKQENTQEVDDRPKPRQVNSEQRSGNRFNFVRGILNNFGVFGVNSNNIQETQELPDPKEVKRNIVSLIVFIIAVGILYYIIKE